MSGKPYVIALYWTNSSTDEECKVYMNAQLVRREVFVDGFHLNFSLERIHSPQNYLFYLMDCSSGHIVENKDNIQSLDKTECEEMKRLLRTLSDPRRVSSKVKSVKRKNIEKDREEKRSKMDSAECST